MVDNVHQLGVHGPHGRLRGGGARDQRHVNAWAPRDSPGCLAQQSLGTIALDGASHATGGDHGNTGGIVVTAGSNMHDNKPPGATAGGQDGGDVSGRAKPLNGQRYRGHESQALSCFRPLRRRFLTIVRPARVRMRVRNPCLRARRRMFGWKVRFMRGPVHDEVRRRGRGSSE